MTPTEPLHPFVQLAYDAIKEGLALLIGFGLPAIFFLRRLLRHEIREGFGRLIHDLGMESAHALQSMTENTTQKLDDVFHRIGGDFVAAFKKSLNDNIIPLLRQSMEDTKRAIEGKMDSWTSPSAVPAVGPTEGADIKRFIDAADFDGLYRKLDSIEDIELKAAQYREVAIICMDYEDRFHSFEAANKYRELLGTITKAEQFLGYVYWWFKDLDTAIVHTENALQLALKLPEQELKKDPGLIYRIKNNLAFYFAQTRINKDRAFSYVTEVLANTSPADEYYVYHIDTAGTVYLNFATSEEEIDKAIQYFLQVLEREPQSKKTQERLIEAYEKKKELRNPQLVSGTRR